jgi:hypothetical protein
MAFDGYISDTTYIGEVLKKNFFYDDVELQTFLNHLTISGLQYAIDTRANYAENIRAELEVYDDIRPKKKVCRISVNDMTEEEMYKQKLQIEKNHRDVMEAKWQSYKKVAELPSRPFGQLDEEYDDLFESLCMEKKRLADYLGSKPKPYVAPGARQSVVLDLTWGKMKDKIESIEYKISAVKKKIEAEEKDWEYKLRHEFLENNF